MLTSIEARRKTFEPAQRGYHAVYRENAVNHCPGCGRTHWHIGRIMAECAFCTTALPLSDSYQIGVMGSFYRARPPIVAANAA